MPDIMELLFYLICWIPDIMGSVVEHLICWIPDIMDLLFHLICCIPDIMGPVVLFDLLDTGYYGPVVKHLIFCI